MSVKFKIAEWKFELDLDGMTATPPEEDRRETKPEDRHKVAIRRSPAPNTNLRQQPEEGEKEAWA